MVCTTLVIFEDGWTCNTLDLAEGRVRRINSGKDHSGHLDVNGAAGIHDEIVENSRNNTSLSVTASILNTSTAEQDVRLHYHEFTALR